MLRSKMSTLRQQHARVACSTQLICSPGSAAPALHVRKKVHLMLRLAAMW